MKLTHRCPLSDTKLKELLVYVFDFIYTYNLMCRKPKMMMVQVSVIKLISAKYSCVATRLIRQ